MNPSHENIDPRVLSLLESIRYVPDRNPQLAGQARQKFLAQARTMEPSTSKDVIMLLKEKIFPSVNLGSPARRLAFKPILITLIVALMLFGSVSGVAFAAQDSLPGQPLYPIKWITEDIRANMSGDPTEKALLETAFVQTRFMEMKAIDQEGADVPLQVIERLNLQLQNVLDTSARLDEANMVRILNRMELVLREGDEIIIPTQNLATKEMNGATLQQYVEYQHRLVQEGVQNPDDFRKRYYGGSLDDQSTQPEEQTGDRLQDRDRIQDEDRQRQQLHLQQTSVAAEEIPAEEQTQQPESTSIPELTPQPQSTAMPQQTPQQLQIQEREQEQQRNQNQSGNSGKGNSDDGGSGGGGGGGGSGKGGK